MNWWPLLPFAVAILVTTLRGRGLVEASVLGYVFGAVYLLTLVSWMRVVGDDAWLLVCLILACSYAVLGAACAVVMHVRGWPVWVAALWVGMDMVRSAWPFGGFPWGRLVWSTVDTPYATWIAWIGADGVSFLVVLSGTTLAWSALRVATSAPTDRPRRSTLGAVAGLSAVGGIVLVPSVLSPSSLRADRADVGSATVALVQGDVPGAGDQLVANFREVTRDHLTATLELFTEVDAGLRQRPDFVVWPENSTAVDPFRDAVTSASIQTAVTRLGVPLLVGAIVDGERADEVRNQGLVYSPTGEVGDRYTKRHPVPFGEYIPYRAFLSGLDVGRLALIPRDMVAGTQTTPLDVGGVAVADAICFDIAFDDTLTGQIRNGAKMVTVQTSNATFIKTDQIEQQFAMSRLRAMETGRTVVVASVNGISGIIAPDGSVQARARPQSRTVLVEEAELRDELTLAVRLEPVVGPGAAVAAVLALAVGLRARRQRSSRPTTT